MVFGQMPLILNSSKHTMGDITLGNAKPNTPLESAIRGVDLEWNGADGSGKHGSLDRGVNTLAP